MITRVLILALEEPIISVQSIPEILLEDLGRDILEIRRYFWVIPQFFQLSGQFLPTGKRASKQTRELILLNHEVLHTPDTTKVLITNIRLLKRRVQAILTSSKHPLIIPANLQLNRRFTDKSG
jgi:hypothetical protein